MGASASPGSGRRCARGHRRPRAGWPSGILRSQTRWRREYWRVRSSDLAAALVERDRARRGARSRRRPRIVRAVRRAARRRRAAARAPRRARRLRASRRCAARSVGQGVRAPSRGAKTCVGQRAAPRPTGGRRSGAGSRRCGELERPHDAPAVVRVQPRPRRGRRGARARRGRPRRPARRTAARSGARSSSRHRGRQRAGRRARRAGRARCRRRRSRALRAPRTSSIAAWASSAYSPTEPVVVERPDADEVVRRAGARPPAVGWAVSDRAGPRTAASRRHATISPARSPRERDARSRSCPTPSAPEDGRRPWRMASYAAAAHGVRRRAASSTSPPRRAPCTQLGRGSAASGKIDRLVRAGAAAQRARVGARGALDQHLLRRCRRAPGCARAAWRLDARDEPLEPLALDVLGHLLLHPRGVRAAPRRVDERERVVVADLLARPRASRRSRPRSRPGSRR